MTLSIQISPQRHKEHEEGIAAKRHKKRKKYLNATGDTIRGLSETLFVPLAPFAAISS
jgi:hypothetical protein